MKPPRRLFRKRPAYSPLLDMPEWKRDVIAGAVHRVVDRVVGPGGKCGYYTMAGTAILMYLGHRVASQFGSLMLFGDPDDPTLAYTIDAESPGALDRGEYHGWIASPEAGGVFIDFSARDWPEMVDGTITGRISVEQAAAAPASAFAGAMSDEVLRWNRPRPDYLWCAGADMPDYVRIRPSMEAIVTQRKRFHEAHGEPFFRMAIETYKAMA
jgi:hypothetical protein